MGRPLGLLGQILMFIWLIPRLKGLRWNFREKKEEYLVIVTEFFRSNLKRIKIWFWLVVGIKGLSFGIWGQACLRVVFLILKFTGMVLMLIRVWFWHVITRIVTKFRFMICWFKRRLKLIKTKDFSGKVMHSKLQMKSLIWTSENLIESWVSIFFAVELVKSLMVSNLMRETRPKFSIF